MHEIKKGAFIVIEGTDGSGKTEQFERLALAFPQDFKFAMLDFPRYKKRSSYFAKEYLNGRYGSEAEVGPYQASLFFALDRFDAKRQAQKWLEERRTIIANRYVASNMAHQGGKIESSEARKKFYAWLFELEYGMLGIPKPDVSIILHMPAAMAQELVDKKNARAYLGGKKRDIHENNLGHLERAERVYLEIANMFPHDFRVIECAENGAFLSPEAVHEKVWSVVKPFV